MYNDKLNANRKPDPSRLLKYLFALRGPRNVGKGWTKCNIKLGKCYYLKRFGEASRPTEAALSLPEPMDSTDNFQYCQETAIHGQIIFVLFLPFLIYFFCDNLLNPFSLSKTETVNHREALLSLLSQWLFTVLRFYNLPGISSIADDTDSLISLLD